MRMSRITLSVFLFVAIILATAGVGMAGGAMTVDDGSVTVASTGDVDIQVDEETIETSLANASGDVEALIVFEAPPVEEVVAADKPEELLQEHAAEQTRSIEELATLTGSVDIEDTDWLTPSVTVSVDTDVVSLSYLASLDGVVAIEDATAEMHLQSGTGPGEANETSSPASSHYTYGLEQINAPDVWDEFNTQGEGASVAVLDTGVDADHQDITLAGWKDFDDNPSQDPMDYGTHGTHVSGTVAGGDAGGEHIGVAPAVDLYVGAVLTEDCSTGCVGSRSTIVDGMEWAVSEDVDVISMSLGGEGYGTSYLQATQNAQAAGTTVVAAAGNRGAGTADTPGNIYSLISVGATNSNEDVAGFSSGMEIITEDAWGSDAPDDWPDTYIVPTVSAPGDDVWSAYPDDLYSQKQGTSMATPHVSGTIALMQSATDRHLDPETIKSVLTDTAWQPGEGTDAEQDTRYGYGIIDAHAAVDTVLDTGDLTGTVSDSVTDEPIEGATVTAVAQDGTEHEATTDSAGSYEFNSLDTGTYTVSTQRNGYDASSESSAEVQSDQVTTTDLTLTGDASIEVDVLEDGFEVPIETASVEAEGDFGTYPMTASENETYILEDIPSIGEFTLSVEAPGYQTATSSISVSTSGEAATAEVAMVGDAQLELTATDVVSGEQISGTQVTLEHDTGAGSTHTVETDENGQITVAVPGTDSQYSVSMARNGYASSSGTTDAVGSGETTSLDLTLSGDAAIEVDVLDGAFDVPIETANLAAAGEFGAYPVTATEDGTYLFENIPSVGTHAVAVNAPGYLETSQLVEVTTADERASMAIEMTGDAELTITLTDAVSETELSGASVTIERSDGVTSSIQTTTNLGGQATIAVPGLDIDYDITAELDGYESVSVTETIDSGDSVPLDVELAGDSSIDLDIEGARFGEAIDGADVTVEGPNGVYDVEALGDGSYQMADIPSIGEYTLTSDAEGYLTGESTVSLDDTGASVSELHQLAGDATLNISVQNDDEEAIEGASLTLELADGYEVDLPETTPESGILKVAVPGLNETYQIAAQAEGYEDVSLESDLVDAGEEVPVTVTMSPPSSFIPGFGVPVAIAGALALVSVFILRRRRS